MPLPPSIYRLCLQLPIHIPGSIQRGGSVGRGAPFYGQFVISASYKPYAFVCLTIAISIAKKEFKLIDKPSKVDKNQC